MLNSKLHVVFLMFLIFPRYSDCKTPASAMAESVQGAEKISSIEQNIISDDPHILLAEDNEVLRKKLAEADVQINELNGQVIELKSQIAIRNDKLALLGVSPAEVNKAEKKREGGLIPLGEEWMPRNPYSGDKPAIKIGKSVYNENCARCHGLGGISGGITPDLRFLPHDADGDEWYIGKVRNGSVRNGTTYMPKFADSDGGPLSQEELWAVRAWLETIYVEQ